MHYLLEVNNLSVSFERMEKPAVDNVSFNISKNRILGIVGESGCGKSTLAKAIIGMIPKCGKVNGGNILYDGQDIVNISNKNKRNILGKEIGIIIQESLSSLNPVKTIGNQFIQILTERLGISKEEALEKTKIYLEKVNCNKEVISKFPFQLSGGQRQRVIIAMAFALKPKLLIADEPTTALDVTLQAQVLSEMLSLKNENESGIILISHNLGVISQVCDDVIVMYKGKIVEYGECDKIINSPSHPYTIGLIKSIPRIELSGNERLFNIPDTDTIYKDGCAFASRCFKADKQCLNKSPELNMNSNGVFVACAHCKC